MFTEFLAQGNKMKLRDSMKWPEIGKTLNAVACLLVFPRGSMLIFFFAVHYMMMKKMRIKWNAGFYLQWSSGYVLETMKAQSLSATHKSPVYK